MPTSKTSKPVCLIVGRDPIAQRYLARCLESKATLHESCQATCVHDILLLGAEIVVVLASSNARTCADSIHSRYPAAKIILESNTGRLEGPGEKNGFLSVIDRAQSRSELVAKVQKALEQTAALAPIHYQSSPGSLDAKALLTRLSSIPIVAGDYLRTSESLLELLLSAVKSGCGCLFLRDPESGFFDLAAFRNMPDRTCAMRVGPSSEIARILNNVTSPLVINNEGTSALDAFAEQLSCDLFIPLHIEGTLHGWFCVRLLSKIGIADLDSLSSIAFFAAESLTQSRKLAAAGQQVRRERSFLTSATDAFAWIKPTGEMEIAHDQYKLISIRKNSREGNLRDLRTSEVKEAVFRARKGQVAQFKFLRKGTRQVVTGSAGPLEDKSVVLHLHQGLGQPSPSVEAEKEWSPLFDSILERTLKDLRIDLTNTAAVAIIQKVQALDQGSWFELPLILEAFTAIFRGENSPAGKIDSDTHIDRWQAVALLIVGLCVRASWRGNEETLLVGMVRFDDCHLIQLDFPHIPASISLNPELLVAMKGAEAFGLQVRFLRSNFGSRVEIAITRESKGECTCEKTFQPCPPVIQQAVFVLQPQPIDRIVRLDEPSQKRAVAIEDFSSSAGGIRTACG